MASTITAISPVSTEEEEALIYARITNDERPLRRLMRKFHAFTSQARNGSVNSSSQVEEAKRAFVLELAAYQMLLRRTALSCQAESRQVLEYQREKERLEKEQILQRAQIITLKASLEEAQLTRKRKMEYDRIADQINALPARSELEQAIKSLELDISGIYEEKEQLTRNVQARREKLEVVQQEMQFMNRVGRENVPDDASPEVEVADATEGSQLNGENQTRESSPGPSRLNPDARPFQPSSSQPSLRESVLRRAHVESTNVSNAPSPITTQEEGEEREDIEMGEVSELDKDRPKRKVKEELEEGEASDQSSELSDPPEI